MNRAEALEVLSEEMERYRKRSYEELKTLIGEVDAHETKARSGTAYNLEIQVFWEGNSAVGDLRVIGSIDDGRWPFFCGPWGTTSSSPRRASLSASSLARRSVHELSAADRSVGTLSIRTPSIHRVPGWRMLSSNRMLPYVSGTVYVYSN